MRYRQSTGWKHGPTNFKNPPKPTTFRGSQLKYHPKLSQISHFFAVKNSHHLSLMLESSLVVGALWMGILTSISPCPLATNIAAVAFLARKGTNRRAVTLSSLAYIAGRMAAYTLLAIIITAGLLSVPEIASFFRDKLEGLIGPGLIIVGMIVSDWLKIRLPGVGGLNELGNRLAERGIVGEFLMGAVFALAFCPVSAALFFGGLIPSVVQSGSSIILPISYGIGTALPVVIAVILIAGGLSTAGARIQKMQWLGSKLQVITGGILIAVGAWLTLRDLLG